MNFEQWIEKINDEVRFFIQEFNTDYDCACASDFSAYPLDKDLEWTLIITPKSEDSFRNNFVKRFPIAKNFSVFTLSLLHELGHLETSYDYRDDRVARSYVRDEESYYNLYNETIATNWAGYWIEENYNYAFSIDKHFTSLIEDCYLELVTE